MNNDCLKLNISNIHAKFIVYLRKPKVGINNNERDLDIVRKQNPVIVWFVLFCFFFGAIQIQRKVY